MKKLNTKRLASTIIASAILVFTANNMIGCDGKGDNNSLTTNQTESQVQTPAEDQTIAQTEVMTEVQTEKQTEVQTAETAAGEIKDIGDYIKEFREIYSNGIDLIRTIADYEMQAWESIYKYPDSKQVDDTFAFLYEKSGVSDTVSQYQEAITIAYNRVLAQDCDRELVRLVSNCKVSFELYKNVVIYAYGTYSEFFSNYDNAYMQAVYDHDELVDYLLEKGYL